MKKIESMVTNFYILPKSSSTWNRLNVTDRQIGKLVYELYGLTEDVITLVEGQK